MKVRSGQELSAREESALANMTLAEAEEGRRELMRMRVLQSYQADKLKRQNKIKSKKYRKLLRKSREKVSYHCYQGCNCLPLNIFRSSLSN